MSSYLTLAVLAQAVIDVLLSDLGFREQQQSSDKDDFEDCIDEQTARRLIALNSRLHTRYRKASRSDKFKWLEDVERALYGEH